MRSTTQQRESILSRIPMGAMGSGEDIGAACVYLASKEAGYVTGRHCTSTAAWRCRERAVNALLPRSLSSNRGTYIPKEINISAAFAEGPEVGL